MTGALAAAEAPTPATHEEQFIAKVRAEIKQQGAYFRKQLIRYRVGFTVAAISTISVPILSGISAVPRWTIGVVGGVATLADLLVALWQLRSTMATAHVTVNGLERILNRYLARVAPYDMPSDDDRFVRFFNDIDSVREQAENAFQVTWATGMPGIPGAAGEHLRRIGGTPEPGTAAPAPREG